MKIKPPQERRARACSSGGRFFSASTRDASLRAPSCGVVGDPERVQRDHDAQREDDVAALRRPVDRCAQIVLLRNHDLEALAEIGRVRAQVGRLRQAQEELGVSAAKILFLARFCEPLACELADRLEHPETACFSHAHEALVHQRLQLVDVGLADALGRLERPPPLKTASRGEQALLVGIEQVVGPLDRRSQRLLPELGIAPALEQVQSLREPA
jgi:hypothetical protein